MNYDPKLKELVAKIDALLQEYEVGACISLTSPTHGEFYYRVPDWTLIEEVKDPKGRTIGMQIQSNNVNTDPLEKERLNLTAFFIFGQRDVAGRMYAMWDSLCKAIERSMKVDHKIEVEDHQDYLNKRKDLN